MAETGSDEQLAQVVDFSTVGDFVLLERLRNKIEERRLRQIIAARAEPGHQYPDRDAAP